MSTPGPVLPDRPRRTLPVIPLAIAVVIVLVVAGGAVWLFRGGDDSSGTAAAGSGASSSGYRSEVKIGVADSSLPYWTTYTELAKSELGVTVDLVNFSDYSLPNPALSQGETDLNQFQHVQYLANYDTTAKDDLQPIGATAIYPLPLYSTTAKSPSELPAGAAVVIPNDAINEARALLVLQSAGLLQLDGGGTAFSTTDDITSSKVEVTAVDAAQTAIALQNGSAAAAVVNNNFATAAKLPTSDIIAQDDPKDPSAAPYVNVFAARKADAGDKTYLALAQLWHDRRVQAVFTKDYPQAVVVDSSAADLQADLAKVEQDAKAAG